ncbi:MAG: metallopeptidase family protein [Tissierellia bacterium]|nr:metallopeptidase family protein [Tissierellia bacterium]
MFPSYDEIGHILDELAEELPAVFFNELNLGIVLVETTKYHHEARSEELVILGEYSRSRLGRQIKIYYGSFKKLYGHLDRQDLVEKLRDTLRHEFTHHIQDLAGNKDLEIEDEIKLEKWRKGNKDGY